MSDPGWTMERTAQQLLEQLEQAQVTAGAPAGKTSLVFLRLRLRPQQVANLLRRASYQHLCIGIINFGTSFLVGSMLSISLYVLLFLAGSGKVEARDWYQQWIQAYGTGVGQSRVRLHEGWEGRHSAQSLDSEIQLSCENDLEGLQSVSANSSVIFLHRPRPYEQAKQSCELLNETLWDPAMHMHTPLSQHMSYISLLSHRPNAKDDLFWISHGDGGSRVVSRHGKMDFHPDHHFLPVICTNSAPFATAKEADTSLRYQVIVDANYERYVGYRDKRSFRFLGIPYAAKPLRRWEYSTPNIGHKGRKGDAKLRYALEFGDMCPQKTREGKVLGNEDCLSLNIFTPFLPQNENGHKTPRANTVGLKPVMVWIHGGSLVAGSGGDKTFDGGNFASRGDVVVVTLNYRLGTLGFMSLRDRHTYGNFGLRDIKTAIEWIRAHIGDFGGDKDHITLVGQSAGAAAVRALLASEWSDEKIDKAIMMSTPGGIGHMADFSRYLSWKEAYNRTTKLWSGDRGLSCHIPKTLADMDHRVDMHLDCLRELSVEKVLDLEPVANKFVMDGEFLRTSELRFARYRSGREKKRTPKIMVGWMRDDSASVIPYPRPEQELNTYLNNISLPNALHSAPKLFAPSRQGGNRSLEDFTAASRIATNLNFRCAAESTAFNAEKGGKEGKLFDDKGVYVYEFDRSYQLLEYPADAAKQALCRPKGGKNKSKERYFKCHSGELYYVFGNLAFMGIEDQDGDDYNFSRMILDTWASFIRTGNPNLNADWLRARGYHSTLEHVEKTKMWRAIGDKDAEPAAESTQQGTNGNYPGESVRILDWPSRNTGWRDLEQCYALGVPLEFYRARHRRAERYGIMGQRIDGVPGETVW